MAKIWGQLERAQLEILTADPSTTALVGRIWINTTSNRVKFVDNATTVQTVLLAGIGQIVNADVNASAAIAYSKLNLATSIVNADISASASIAYSKLNLATSIVNADISASAAIAYSKLSLALSIVNADVAAAAAIAGTKIAPNFGSQAVSTTSSGTFNSVVVGSSANTITALQVVSSDTSLTFKTNSGTTAGSISTSQIWTIGVAGSSTQTVNGNLKVLNTGGTANIILDTSGSFDAYIGIARAGTVKWYIQSEGTSADALQFYNAAVAKKFNLTQAGAFTLGNSTSDTVAIPGTLTIGTAGTPTGYTPTAFSVYEEGSFTANFNNGAGAGGAFTSWTVNFRRIGKVVILHFPDMVTMTCGATASVFNTAASTVAAYLCPAQTVNVLTSMRVNSSYSNTPGFAYVASNGVLGIQRDILNTGTFTATQTNNGPLSFTMTYTVA